MAGRDAPEAILTRFAMLSVIGMGMVQMMALLDITKAGMATVVSLMVAPVVAIGAGGDTFHLRDRIMKCAID